MLVDRAAPSRRSKCTPHAREVLGAADLQRLQPKSEALRRRRGLLPLACLGCIARVPGYPHSRDARNSVHKQLQPLGAQLEGDARYSGDLAARARGDLNGIHLA
jgi:hypothetical protein